MEDPKPSSSDHPSYQSRRDQSATHRVPPGEQPASDFPPPPAWAEPEAAQGDPIPLSDEEPLLQPDDGSAQEPPPSVFASQSPLTPHEPAQPADYSLAQNNPESEPPAARPEPLRNNLPGNAAPVPVVPAAPVQKSKAVIYRPPAPQPPAKAARDVKIPGPRSGLFTFLAIVWLLCWTGALCLTLNRPFDRKGDWDTNLWSTAARNLVREGFMPLKGGVYISAGQGFDATQRQFYAGRPPMTAWILAGWMKAFNINNATGSEAIIRSLALAFTALNLLLLFGWVKRVFGSGAGLATLIACSILPMTAFYAQNINSAIFTLTFILLAAHGYLSWATHRSRFGLILLFIAVVLGCLTDWPMYGFAGLLALFHFLHHRVPLAIPLPAADAENPDMPSDNLPPRPVLVSLALLVVPVIMFLLFIGYLKYNSHSLSDLLQLGQEHWAVAVPATQPAGAASQPSASTQPAASPNAQTTRTSGLKLALQRVTNFDRKNQKELFDNVRARFLSLFTIPGLALAVLGGVFWPKWSRRLVADPESIIRRAAFRVLLCIFLTQVVYSVVFIRGAWQFEIWQYYLIVPVAVFVAGFCVWLTVTGDQPRRFRIGLADRLAWAGFFLMAIAAVGPLAWRLQVSLPGRPLVKTPAELNLELKKPILDLTAPGDVILTDMTTQELQMALPWYTDRYIVASDAAPIALTTEQGIKDQLIELEKQNRNVFYLRSPWAPKALVDNFLTRQYPRTPKAQAAQWVFYRLRPRDGTWNVPAGYEVAQPTGPTLPAASGTGTTTPPPASRPATQGTR